MLSRIIFFRAFLVGILSLLLSFSSVGQNLIDFLKNQPEIESIDTLQGPTFFSETYQINIRQPLNYKDTADGFFLQRIFVNHKAVDRPVVYITEGYAADYAALPNHVNELSSFLSANQICVEHRYFGQSVPAPVNWQFLTVENAANDHHRIVQLFKAFYAGKWLNTGISKGGQTALFHRAFFPNDVDATVAYVAPLNFGVEDGRHEPFLQEVGPDSCRQRIRAFQRQVLQKRKQIIPLLKNYAKAQQFTFPMNLNKVLDYLVLEYAFSFWQWGSSCSDIPPADASAEDLFNYLTNISPPSYFSHEGAASFRAFFYQAAAELGYYGYDTSALKDLLVIESTHNYVNQYMIPPGSKPVYSAKSSNELADFLKHKAQNIWLIYGEHDPWTASGAAIRKRGNNHKIILENGDHKTRIRLLPEKKQLKVIKQLNQIMD